MIFLTMFQKLFVFAQDSSRSHDKGTIEMNGILERVVRRASEGSASVLVQIRSLQAECGTNHWNVILREQNVQDSCAAGRTPFENRFCAPFDGPIVLVEQKFFTKPISEKDTHHLHHLGKKDVVWHFLKESLAHKKWMDKRLAHRKLRQN